MLSNHWIWAISLQLSTSNHPITGRLAFTTCTQKHLRHHPTSKGTPGLPGQLLWCQPSSQGPQSQALPSRRDSQMGDWANWSHPSAQLPLLTLLETQEWVSELISNERGHPLPLAYSTFLPGLSFPLLCCFLWPHLLRTSLYTMFLWAASISQGGDKGFLGRRLWCERECPVLLRSLSQSAYRAASTLRGTGMSYFHIAQDLRTPLPNLLPIHQLLNV